MKVKKVREFLDAFPAAARFIGDWYLGAHGITSYSGGSKGWKFNIDMDAIYKRWIRFNLKYACPRPFETLDLSETSSVMYDSNGNIDYFLAYYYENQFPHRDWLRVAIDYRHPELGRPSIRDTMRFIQGEKKDEDEPTLELIIRKTSWTLLGIIQREGIEVFKIPEGFTLQ